MIDNLFGLHGRIQRQRKIGAGQCSAVIFPRWSYRQGTRRDGRILQTYSSLELALKVTNYTILPILITLLFPQNNLSFSFHCPDIFSWHPIIADFSPLEMQLKDQAYFSSSSSLLSSLLIISFSLLISRTQWEVLKVIEGYWKLLRGIERYWELWRVMESYWELLMSSQYWQLGGPARQEVATN